ncbi:MAG: hypothetical protein KA144_03525 [Xanthomonadaceae bacterium]|nr:hypothetical protein [Xanthomonadaceae bacterium]
MAAIIALLLTGCLEAATQDNDNGDQFRRDAADNNDQARIDTSRDVAEANRRMERSQQALSNHESDKILTEFQSAEMMADVQTVYDVALLEADRRHRESRRQCDDINGKANHACVEILDDALAADLSLAAHDRDTAIVAVEYRK